jgi:hypothetical protein
LHTTMIIPDEAIVVAPATSDRSGRSVAALARQGSLVEAKHRLASLCNTIEIRLYIHRVPAIAWVDAL